MKNGKGARCVYLPELPEPPPRLEPVSAPRPAELSDGAEAAGALPELPEEEGMDTAPAERDDVL